MIFSYSHKDRSFISCLIVVYMKKVNSHKIVFLKTSVKAGETLTFIEIEKQPATEEKVIPLSKSERFQPINSRNTYGLFKRKVSFNLINFCSFII